MESFENQFAAFSKFGDKKSDGTTITLSQSDKWMKQANIFDKKITTTDTAIHFRKLKSMKLHLSTYKEFLRDLAQAKCINLNDLKNKMVSCGPPIATKAKTNAKAEANVERLTNTKNYTGTHKERFDASGKGMGLEGRKNLAKWDGYVSGFKKE